MMRTGPIGSPAPLGSGLSRVHMWLTIVVGIAPPTSMATDLAILLGKWG